MSLPQLAIAISGDASDTDVAMIASALDSKSNVSIAQATSSSDLSQSTTADTRVTSAHLNSLPTLSNAQVLISTTTTSTDFKQFAKLAVEIQMMVWKATIAPRLVHWRPGGGNPPSELLTNKHSYEVLKKEYAVFQFRAPRLNDKYTLYFHYEFDTLYRRHHFPNPIKVGPHGPQTCFLRNSWSQPIRKLALDLGQAWGLLCSDKHRNNNSPNNLVFMLRLQFPLLKQLSVVLKPSLEIGQTLEGIGTLNIWDPELEEQYSEDELDKLIDIYDILQRNMKINITTLGDIIDWGGSDKVLGLRYVKIFSEDENGE